MTYMTLRRALAIQESWTLRAWARAGRRPPRSRPINVWAEWDRQKHRNNTTKRTAA